MCGPIWFLAVRSREGKSAATFWRASWWARKDKTTNGLPPSSGAIQTKDFFNEKPTIPLRKQHVVEEWKRKSPSSRGIQRAFKPRDMDTNPWIRRKRSTVNADRAT
jgi:hypothetical protein